MKPALVRGVPMAAVLVALLAIGIVTLGNDGPAGITPEPLKVAELSVIGKALPLRYAIDCGNGCTVVRVRYEMYRNGKGPRVLWEGRAPATTDGKGRAKVLITLQELPPRAVWDQACAEKAPADARDMLLSSVNGELGMLPVPSAGPGQVWSWRGSGPQRHGGQGFAVLAVGVLDKVFPRLPLGWEKDPEALKRVQDTHCAIVVKAKME